jgi:hypothetical protein
MGQRGPEELEIAEIDIDHGGETLWVILAGRQIRRICRNGNIVDEREAAFRSWGWTFSTQTIDYLT